MRLRTVKLRLAHRVRVLLAWCSFAPAHTPRLADVSMVLFRQWPCQTELCQPTPGALPDAGVIQGLSWTDRLLFVWILGAMVIGVVCGKFIPSLRDRFAVAELYGTPLPIAIGLWLMMWPVLSKVRSAWRTS